MHPSLPYYSIAIPNASPSTNQVGEDMGGKGLPLSQERRRLGAQALTQAPALARHTLTPPRSPTLACRHELLYIYLRVLTVRRASIASALPALRPRHQAAPGRRVQLLPIRVRRRAARTDHH